MCLDLIPKMQAKSPGGKSLGNLISRGARKFQALWQEFYAIRCLWFSGHAPPGEFMSGVVRESYVPWCLRTLSCAAWEFYILCLSAFGIYVACCVRNLCSVLSDTHTHTRWISTATGRNFISWGSHMTANCVLRIVTRRRWFCPYLHTRRNH